MPNPPYASSVFVNCPFTSDYSSLFRALVFAVVDCGFNPRCAQEEIDGGAVRIQKIERIIEGCKFGIHDLSNQELDSDTGLPRFNMPFELGLFLGAKRYGTGNQKNKQLIILDKEPYRYQQSLSDISGQDIDSHGGDIEQLIKRVRNWLNSKTSRKSIPGARHVFARYQKFEKECPDICLALRFDIEDIPYNDLLETIAEWQAQNAQSSGE